MTTPSNERYNSKSDGKGLVKNKRLCIISTMIITEMPLNSARNENGLNLYNWDPKN
ncbi:MAG: hypothetical protein WBQ25_22315 [Nitrososphaeraceae archaeon]